MAFSAVYSSPSPTRVSSWASSSPFVASFPPLPVKLSLGLGSPKSHGLSYGAALRSRNSSFAVYARATSGKSVHDFTVKDIDKKEVSLSKFKGKLLLIVNVASRWYTLLLYEWIWIGLTSSNYKELSDLYEKYKSQGLEILAFPCNQFGFQEPGSNQEIKDFACTRFKAEFPIFDKVDVNGPFTAPIYEFLKSSSGGFLGDLVKWNFEKFLVDKNGKVVERYPPTTSPLQLENDIKKLLAA